MAKYILGTLLLLMLALNVAAYVYFVREIDGSTVTTKHGLSERQPR